MTVWQSAVVIGALLIILIVILWQDRRDAHRLANAETRTEHRIQASEHRLNARIDDVERKVRGDFEATREVLATIPAPGSGRADSDDDDDDPGASARRPGRPHLHALRGGGIAGVAMLALAWLRRNVSPVTIAAAGAVAALALLVGSPFGHPDPATSHPPVAEGQGDDVDLVEPPAAGHTPVPIPAPRPAMPVDELEPDAAEHVVPNAGVQPQPVGPAAPPVQRPAAPAVPPPVAAVPPQQSGPTSPAAPPSSAAPPPPVEQPPPAQQPPPPQDNPPPADDVPAQSDCLVSLNLPLVSACV